MIDILGPLLVFIVPLSIVAFYGYLIIDTIKRLFRNSLKIFPKIFFCVSAVLSIIVIPAGLILMDMSTSFPSCPSLDTFLSIKWEKTLERISSMILFAVPFLLLIIALILRCISSGGEKIIHTRTLYVLILSIAIILGIALLPLNSARSKRSIDAGMKASLYSVMIQNKMYFYDHDKYPMVAELNAAERWNELREIYKQELHLDLPDSQCYKRMQDPRYQYDYINSPDGLRYVATILLLGPLKSNNPKFLYWCVDNTGIQKEIESLPGDNQFSCSK